MTSEAGRAGGRGLARAAPGAIVAAVLLLAGLIFPLVITNETATQIAVDTLLYVAAAVAWNLFSGFSGYISLGHAVFFGVGAYTVGIAARDWHVTGDLEFALLPLAGLAAGLVAVPRNSKTPPPPPGPRPRGRGPAGGLCLLPPPGSPGAGRYPGRPSGGPGA